MCELLVESAGDVDAAVSAYAKAEKIGRAPRVKNASGLSGTEYGYALVKDGLRRGWLMTGA